MYSKDCLKKYYFIFIAFLLLGNVFISFSNDVQGKIGFSEYRSRVAKQEIRTFIKKKQMFRKVLAISSVGTVSSFIAYHWMKEPIVRTNVSVDTFYKVLQEMNNKKVEINNKENIESSTWSDWFDLKKWIKSVPSYCGSFGKDVGKTAFSLFKFGLAGSLSELVLHNSGIYQHLSNIIIMPDLLWIVKNRTLLDLKMMRPQYIQTENGSIEVVEKSLPLDKSNIEEAIHDEGLIYSNFINEIRISKSSKLSTKLAVRDIEKVCGYMDYRIEICSRSKNFMHTTLIQYVKQLRNNLKDIADSLIKLYHNLEDNNHNSTTIINGYKELSGELTKSIIRFNNIESQFD